MTGDGSGRDLAVAVVLGNAVTCEGLPSRRLRARLETAVMLYATGKADRVLVSGGIDRHGNDEAACMAAYLETRGVPPAAIMRDPHGDDTFETARNTTALVRPGDRVTIVTQWFHVPRTLLAMRRFGLRRVAAAAPRYVELRDAYSFVREIAALPFYAVRRVGRRAPAGSRRSRP